MHWLLPNRNSLLLLLFIKKICHALHEWLQTTLLSVLRVLPLPSVVYALCVRPLCTPSRSRRNTQCDFLLKDK